MPIYNEHGSAIVMDFKIHTGLNQQHYILKEHGGHSPPYETKN